MAINIRSTTMRTLNNITVIIPNSEFISSNVINWSHGDPKIRLEIPVGGSYNSDLPAVLRVLREVALENSEVLKTPEPEVLLTNFGDSSWDMLLRAWISDPKRHPLVRSELNCAIVDKFRPIISRFPSPSGICTCAHRCRCRCQPVSKASCVWVPGNFVMNLDPPRADGASGSYKLKRPKPPFYS